MTDRDEFAKAALTGLLASDTDAPLPSGMSREEYQQLGCKHAYEYADAMLAESSKPHAPGPVSAEALGALVTWARQDAEDGDLERCVPKLRQIEDLVARMKEQA